MNYARHILMLDLSKKKLQALKALTAHSVPPKGVLTAGSLKPQLMALPMLGLHPGFSPV